METLVMIIVFTISFIIGAQILQYVWNEMTNPTVTKEPSHVRRCDSNHEFIRRVDYLNRKYR